MSTTIISPDAKPLGNYQKTGHNSPVRPGSSSPELQGRNPSAEPESNSSEESSRLPVKDKVQISAEAREIAKLSDRDREVRAHEAAHAAVGGRYAGSPSLTYSRGPDGRAYATGGEVSIDTAAVTGDPLATLQKASIIRAAALAPAQPSAQDLRVASRAAALAAQAQAELSKIKGGKLTDSSDPEQGETSDNLSGEISSAASSRSDT